MNNLPAEPGELEQLRTQVADLQSALRAIASGDIDALVIGEDGQSQIYSHSTADRPYRMIIEEMGEGAATVSADGLVLFANHRLEQLVQLELGSLLGKPISNLVATSQRPLLDQLLAINTGETSSSKLDLLRSNGSTTAALVSSSGLATSEGLIHCLIATDHSQLDKVEKALIDSELSYRMLALNAQDGILILDWDSGRITMANPYISQVLGCKPLDLIGKQLWEIGAFVDKNKAIDIYAELKQKGYVRYEDMPLKALDGSLKEVEFVSNVYLVGGQKVIQCNIRDISDRKAAERQSKQYQSEMMQALHQIVAALVAMNEARDPYTAGHEARVSHLAAEIASELGLSAHQCEGIRIAGLVHDIGKFSIPAEILTKPNRISPQELALLQTHAQAGYEALREIQFPWPVAQAVLQHHERLDGSGYPQGLKGDEIALESRILAVADTVEAMASNRPYRVSPGLEPALAIIEAGSGSLFDAKAVAACLGLFREKAYTLPRAPGAF